MSLHANMSSTGPFGEDFWQYVFFVVFAIVAAVGAVFAAIAERKRREAFAQLAASLNLTYVRRDDAAPHRYAVLDIMRQGDTRYAFNVLRGVYKEHPVEAFDYHYATHSTDSKGRRHTQHHYLSVFVLVHGLHFPELRIYPENFLGRLAEMIGFDDIDFESVAFSRAFTVRSRDRKFAFDICHARMMEYLLAHRDLRIEIDGPYLALIFQQRLRPEHVTARLDQAVDIRNLFPQYLYKA
ncbi:MAG TPA: hypothetical protein PLO62_04365 [Candidatus Hydrogenedentes bacterium]|nr:hypothetical protein [Candidatus Hydrogenedentota bacterium]HOS01763.1 hypothetical protein [Candidatus Hydrogenedentota bacterium]